MTASQKEAERLLKLLRKYFKYKLKVELSDEKTVITNLEENHVDFLGYRLSITHGLTERSYDDGKILQTNFGRLLCGFLHEFQQRLFLRRWIRRRR